MCRMITIIGKSQVKIEVSKIVAVIDSDESTENGNSITNFINKAMKEGRFQPLLTDKKKIKSYILTTNNLVFPSSVRAVTISERLEETEKEK